MTLFPCPGLGTGRGESTSDRIKSLTRRIDKIETYLKELKKQKSRKGK